MFSSIDKRTQILRDVKRVVKPKAGHVKTKVKANPSIAKRSKVTKEKVDKKSKPAPIAEAGYSLYSSNSDVHDVSTESETCAQLLQSLRDRKKVSNHSVCFKLPPSSYPHDSSNHGNVCQPSNHGNSTLGRVQTGDILPGVRIPFNDRLSSSTPDPDRPQEIPEKDVSQATASSAGTLYWNPNEREFMKQGVTGVPGNPIQGFYPADARTTGHFAVPPGTILLGSKGQSSLDANSINDSSLVFDPISKQYVLQPGACNFKVVNPVDSQSFPVSAPAPYNNIHWEVPERDTDQGQGQGQPITHAPAEVFELAADNSLSTITTAQGTLTPRSVTADVQYPSAPAPEYQGEGHSQSSSSQEVEEMVKNTLARMKGNIASGKTVSFQTQQTQPSHSSQMQDAPREPSGHHGNSYHGNSSEGHDLQVSQNASHGHSVGSQASNASANSINPGVSSSRVENSSRGSQDSTGSTDSKIKGQSQVLYQLVQTEQGMQLVPMNLFQHPSVLTVSTNPVSASSSLQGQGQSGSQGQGHNNSQGHSSKSSQHNSSQGKSQDCTNSQRNTLLENVSSQMASMPSSLNQCAECRSPPVKGAGSRVTEHAHNGDDSGHYSVDTNPWSRVKLDAGLKRLHYLVREVKACSQISNDIETMRLAKEIEKTLENIPQLRSTFSLQSEIDLAIQPLRNENAQLRRRLRLASHTSNDQDNEKKPPASNVDFNVLQLEASNTALQRQIKEEKEAKVKLTAEVKDLTSQIKFMKIERSKLLSSQSEKETEDLKVKQECLADSQKLRQEMDAMRRQIEAAIVQQEASDQENHILRVSLHQRDMEIARLQEMIDCIKEGVSDLLHDLEPEGHGNQSTLSNGSIGLGKIMKILGRTGQQPVRFADANESASSLTQQALAEHDLLHTRADNFRPVRGDNFRSSNSDTEVELAYDNVGNRSHPAFRNLSAERGRQGSRTGHRRALSSSPTNEDRLSIYSNNPHLQQFARESWLFPDSSTRQKLFDVGPDVGRQRVSTPTGENQSEAAMSRYSVTDYFRKYPSSAGGRGTMDLPSFLTSSEVYSNNAGRPPVHLKYRDQTLDNFHSISFQPQFMRPTPYFDWSSAKPPRHKGTNFYNNIFTQGRRMQGRRSHGQRERTLLDNSVSAIDDDNFSSVSGSGRTNVTANSSINDTKFKKGIATLDANILKLQLALQRTKNRLNN